MTLLTLRGAASALGAATFPDKAKLAETCIVAAALPAESVFSVEMLTGGQANLQLSIPDCDIQLQVCICLRKTLARVASCPLRAPCKIRAPIQTQPQTFHRKRTASNVLSQTD